MFLPHFSDNMLQMGGHYLQGSEVSIFDSFENLQLQEIKNEGKQTYYSFECFGF